MKVCETCGIEIGGRDCDTQCQECERKELGRKAKARARREREQVLRDCGLVKVKSALGGTYWE